jgi:hypothetical protein
MVMSMISCLLQQTKHKFAAWRVLVAVHSAYGKNQGFNPDTVTLARSKFFVKRGARDPRNSNLTTGHTDHTDKKKIFNREKHEKDEREKRAKPLFRVLSCFSWRSGSNPPLPGGETFWR